MTLEPSLSVHSCLEHLAARLDPLIGDTLAQHLGGLPWTTVLTELDKMRGRPPKTYTVTDLQAQLRMLTERLGNLGFPFDDNTRLVTTLGSELRIVRNRWAHNDELTTLDAWRVHDFAVRLLEHFGDSRGVQRASELRDQAFNALAAEKGVAVHVAAPGLEPEPVPAVGRVVDAEAVSPDPSVLSRAEAGFTPTIGASRGAFQPWTVVLIGDVSVLDDLPKKVAKEKVRAVATEIAEFEGPIHLDRLVRLTAASFGVQRLRAVREKKLTYQLRQTGLVIDDDRFVWPSDLDPKAWSEFRPNDSAVERSFMEVSPVEIGNAVRFIRSQRSGLSEGELDGAVLQTFGRKRRTKQIVAHLARAKALSGAAPSE